MTAARFQELLRAMYNLDRHKVGLSGSDWIRFRDDPFRFMVRANKETAKIVWDAINSQTPEDETK